MEQRENAAYDEEDNLIMFCEAVKDAIEKKIQDA